MTMKINDVEIISEQELTKEQAEKILAHAEANKVQQDATIEKITVIVNEDGMVDLDLEFKQDKPQHERVRRITGYLSVINTWNNAKQEELKDRVAHTVE